MPQTITPRVHCTVKLPASDLATVNYAGGEGGGIFIRNYGPGDVWLSADPAYPASIGNVNNYLLAKTDYVAMGGVSRGAYLTLMSDQANTQVSIAFSSK
jgi:hypothetical protein